MAQPELAAAMLRRDGLSTVKKKQPRGLTAVRDGAGVKGGPPLQLQHSIASAAAVSTAMGSAQQAGRRAATALASTRRLQRKLARWAAGPLPNKAARRQRNCWMLSSVPQRHLRPETQSAAGTRKAALLGILALL